MFSKNKIIGLIVVLLMVCAAAITVNKTLFGYKIEKSVSTATPASVISDTITVSPDGTTVIHTANLPGTISGYAGPVPLDIYISNGKITDIETLPNAESPSFFERATKVLSSWIGKTPKEAHSMQVDGISNGVRIHLPSSGEKAF